MAENRTSFLKAIPMHARRSFCEIIESGSARLVTDRRTGREVLLYTDNRKAFEATPTGIRAVPVPKSFE